MREFGIKFLRCARLSVLISRNGNLAEQMEFHRRTPIETRCSDFWEEMPTCRELISEYKELLAKLQQKLEVRHFDATATRLHEWQEQLKTAECDSALRIHAERTQRSLGGMESV